MAFKMQDSTTPQGAAGVNAASGVEPSAFNYDSYQQYAHERSVHDQAIHSMTAVGSQGKASAAVGGFVQASQRPKLQATADKGDSSPSKQGSESPGKKDPSSAASSPSVSGRNDSLKSNRLCTMPGCKKRVRSKGLCKAHGGGRRCMVDGCERSSQGQGLCIRHGGGKRCTQPGCTKASQSNGLCKAHGGGLRCQAPGCTKSSQGGGFCRAHGGGQRCEKEGCNKGAQRGGFCAGHGGSRFCQHPDCTKNDRGGGFCAEHGGGKRCDHPSCNKPARKKGKCSYHANAAKGKPGKDPLVARATAASSTAAAAAVAAAQAQAQLAAPGGVPPHIMDMRQLTNPAYQSGMPMGSMQKDLRDAAPSHVGMDHRSLPTSYQQRVELDQRYGAPPSMKGYDAGPGGPSSSAQYMQLHADQRYDQLASSRHYGMIDSSSLPPVSSRQPPAYGGREYGKPQAPVNVNPYSQQWSKPGDMQQHQDARGVDYFDLKDQQHQQYAPSSQYHHHMSATDSAAYGNHSRGGGSYYHPVQGGPPSEQGQSAQNQPPNMMYYSNGYQPHQMHNMQQMTLL